MFIFIYFFLNFQLYLTSWILLQYRPYAAISGQIPNGAIFYALSPLEISGNTSVKRERLCSFVQLKQQNLKLEFPKTKYNKL